MAPASDKKQIEVIPATAEEAQQLQDSIAFYEKQQHHEEDGIKGELLKQQLQAVQGMKVAEVTTSKAFRSYKETKEEERSAKTPELPIEEVKTVVAAEEPK